MSIPDKFVLAQDGVNYRRYEYYIDTSVIPNGIETGDGSVIGATSTSTCLIASTSSTDFDIDGLQIASTVGTDGTEFKKLAALYGSNVITLYTTADGWMNVTDGKIATSSSSYNSTLEYPAVHFYEAGVSNNWLYVKAPDTVWQPLYDDDDIEPTKTIEVAANGTYFARPADGYKLLRNVDFVVDVQPPEGSVIPSGEVSITSNGTHDVSGKATAKVNVPIPDGYIVPTGNITITENGDYDVTEKAGVKVNVPTPDGYVMSLSDDGTEINFVWGSAVKEITFTVYSPTSGETFTCTAVEGMTWAEWCESDYDTLNCYVTDNNSVLGSAYIQYNSISVQGTDVIIANGEYSFEAGSGGAN